MISPTGTEPEASLASVKAQVDGNNNNDSVQCGSATTQEAAGCCTKYQLRPRALQARCRLDTQWFLPSDLLRQKLRPPPLSRYRRKTANARERYRMRQINRAFESLRGVLPAWVASRRVAADMTKIKTLRLASAYIRQLQDILEGDVSQENPWGQEVSKTTPPTRCHVREASLSPQDPDLLTLICSIADDSGAPQDDLELVCLAQGSNKEAVASCLTPGSNTEVMASCLAPSSGAGAVASCLAPGSNTVAMVLEAESLPAACHDPIHTQVVSG